MMLEDALTRLLDELKAQVLVLLTRAINDAFDQALAPSGVGKDAKVTSAPKQPSPTQRHSRRAKLAQTTAGQQMLRLSSSDDMNEASAVANTETPQPRSKRAKGPSRDEIDRLVQAGLASRIAGEKSAPTAPDSSPSQY